ncbi:MAG: hypothetical protein RJA81_376 [Planctomycetota bacterium]
MSFISAADVKDLLNEGQGGTNVSLFMTTAMTYPESEKNPIIFKDLLKQLENELASHFSGRDFKPILSQFQKFQTEDEFWKTRTSGLAMFLNGNGLKVFDVPRPVPDTVIVAESFHLKPIFRVLQTTDRFHILTIDRTTAHIFEANRDTILPINRKDMPKNSKEHDLGARTTVSEQHFSGFGRSTVTLHDTEEKSHDSDFFKEVDRFVQKFISNHDPLPLVLVGLSEHQGTFRKVSNNPHLASEGVASGPSGLSARELKDKAFAVVEKIQHQFVKGMIDQVEQASAHGRGSTDLAEIARAAISGRVGSLLVDADRIIPGKLLENGEIQMAQLSDPQVDDLLDDLMEKVFQAEGDIHVLPSGIMPFDSGVAAVFRY